MNESRSGQKPKSEEGASSSGSISRRRFVTSLGILAGAAITSQIPAGIQAYAQEDSAELWSAEGSKKAKTSVHIDWYNVKDYNVLGNGSRDDAAALEALIQSTAQRAEATLYFPAGTYRIGSHLTFPRRVHLRFDYGAMLVPDAGVIVKIQSSVEAGLGHIFGGAGKVTGDFYGQGVYPQWWGAKGDKQTDDTEAFRNVFRLSKDNQISVTVYVPRGDYVWSQPVVVYGNTSVICEQGAVFWRNHGNTMMYNYEYNGEANAGYSGNGNILFENARFEFVGLNPSVLCYEDGNILQFAHASDWTFRHCEFYDVIDAHAIEINSSQNVVIDGCKFYGYRELANNRWYVEAIQIDHASTSGIQGALPYDDTHCKNITIQNCYFGKGHSYTFNKGGIATTVEFKAWTAGVGGHTHKEGKWHQNITIRNNTFEGMRYYAIRPYKWLNTLIAENRFYECGGGIYAVSGANHAVYGAAGPFRRLSIVNNQFINGVAVYPDFFAGNRRFMIGIFSTDVVSEDVQIAGNTFSVAEDTGIIIRNVKRISVCNNTINYMKKDAIEITGCLNVTVQGNQIFKPSEYGVLLKNCNHCLILDNQINEAQKQSIYIEDGENVQIGGSVITNGRETGIGCEGLQGLIAKDNQISDSPNALIINHCRNVRVIGNHAARMSTNGMEIAATTGLLVSGNFLIEGAGSVYDALVIKEGTNMGVVRDNILSGAFRRGIWFEGTTSNIKYGYNVGPVQNDSSQVEPLQD
ncbi:right-handed parallel beta-helix repeat-containing protein [Paenibacillus sp. 32O-W]|uniref:right-handed parallel beta-helix repeat-containing protein n=1 Tax=Paenibacillus sp. 32O-W TaxID=1695218 RepID=UPI0011AAAE0F|nr:right-handed parallel beta-helix repeat-containing protein [Paenibacillus sp. 32O-W]